MSEKCVHCGAKLEGRWERLTPGLCRTLRKFYEAAKIDEQHSTLRTAHLQADCGFTKNEFTNFQKLRYFSLVRKTSKAGIWEMTRLGDEFLLNRLAITKAVYVFRNEVKKQGDEKGTIGELMDEWPYWLKREDYIQPAPATTFQEVLFQ